jgi:hypothetical protein
VNAAIREGFTAGGSIPCGEANQSLFTSLTRGELNLIVTDDEGFADRFMLATRLCTRLNLKMKDERVALFQAVLYGNG